MESGDTRCRLCEDKTRCLRDTNRLMSCLNLCLIIAVTLYVAVLHKEVVGLRTELGQCIGSGVNPVNGDVDVRVLETDEVEVDELFYSNGHSSEMETTAAVVTPEGHPQRLRRAARDPVAKRKAGKRNKKRHRKREIREDFGDILETSIKALHMGASMPLNGPPISGDEVRYLDNGGEVDKNGYSPPDIEGDMKFRYWYAANWTKNSPSIFEYDQETGQTKVKEAGLYFIYSQITLSSETSRSGYSIYIDNEARFTCVRQRSSDSSSEFLTNTCSTSALAMLRRGQRISIGVESEDLKSLMKTKLTFWGMFKVAKYRP